MTAQLKDLAQPTRTFPLGETALTLHPLTIGQIALIAERFPLFTELINHGAPMAVIASRLPIAVPLMIAMSLRQPDAEEAAANLGIQIQVAILEKIAEITIPDGVRPLMDQLVRIVTGSSEGSNGDPGAPPPVISPH